ncbi:MAG: glycosyltransferase family 2 protein [Gloeomargarita sp. SKYBB_i_bin120]|nr:glycosyltransferase family 2 protein [Gloeomargarita sp. SKYG98]MCS7291389.1 glycosyltransferase family 2 protein [Gloeomargarita sp. SKYB120]MDW8176949.1 glycosyltransferase family 2 protein [Gloeomargarita sp. SKYBB_i_bin120]
MQRLSVVIPIYNEVDNIPHLIPAVTEVLQSTGWDYEVICVDDGSRDGSTERLRHLAQERYDLKVVVLRRNYGQTAALAAGFDQATGDVVVTLDGDLQNDPQDIPRLLDKLAEGYDLVCGWRQYRQDPGLTRLLPSRVANWLIGRVTGVPLHDYGCTLKAYRRELLQDMHLYGELHRFLPALADIEGARIAEIPVRHYPRRFGRSKYGLGRTFRVLMDLLTIAFMKTFLTRPMHGFGLMGLLFLLLGLGLGIYLAILKWGWGQSIGQRPLLFLSGLAVTSGLQLFCFGLLAELLMRTYHESQGRPIYRIREVVAGRPRSLVN